MSTSDPNSLFANEQLRGQVVELPGKDTTPSGAFATEVIARLANELFSAAPSSLSIPVPSLPAGVPVSVPNSQATMPAFQPEVQLPSDRHLPTLPASAGLSTVSPATAHYQAGPPAVPGAVADVSDTLPIYSAQFSFLQEARPLTSPVLQIVPSVLSSPVPVSQHPYVVANLTDIDWGAFENAQTLSPNAISTPFSTEIDVPSEVQFGFLEELRLPFSNGASSEFLDGKDQDVPRVLDLTSFPFDAESVKHDFPILRERVNGQPLVWLDNAATTQKPQSVIDRLAHFYEHENSNIHRAAHELAARATDAYEKARENVSRFVNASSTNEIIFVRGTTEGINLIANTWGRRNIGKDDEIVITWLEHHANIVPWQLLCSATGAKLRVAPVDDSGQVLLDEYEKLLGPRTKLVSFTQVSNALGVITPAKQMIDIAHCYGAIVLLDGAQSVSHMQTDVQALDCDFFVFSGHKVFGPTGIGAVYGKASILEHMPPWEGGGNMIQNVTFEKTTFSEPPQRFEAGTGNIADAVGLGAAIDYLDRIGMSNIAAHEHELLIHATFELQRIPGLTILGSAKEKAAVISFVVEGFRTEEVGSHLNRQGIAVRSGHHCAQPILRRFGHETTVRPSFALYNTHDDVQKLVRAVWDLRLGHTSIS